ncbi:hypothetical protein AC1031_007929 [Aphanomyces cochlioides]|nr:hypothetical protein AC1031_007929 [Aphanomyces cochlioides]
MVMGSTISTEVHDRTVIKPLSDMITIFDPKFVTMKPLNLEFKPHILSWSIVDAFNQTLYFITSGGLLTRKFDDHNKNAVAILKEQMFTWKQRRDVFTPEMNKICTISCSVSPWHNELECQVFDSSTKQWYVFQLEGSWTQRKAIIRCNGVPVAKTWKRDGFFQNALLVELAPGVDAAFLALLCMILERAARDDRRRRHSGGS